MTEHAADRLLEHLLAAAPPGAAACRLSLIGLSKNAGKTVTLNHLVRAAVRRGLPLGLLSTGRDGEEEDALTELPKPRIWAPEGALVATARGALGAGTAEVRVLSETGFSTPFGPLLIGRVERAGEVLLIGPGMAARIAELLDALEAGGARLLLLDGSFDRIAAAAVAGRAVLAAGAAYSTAMGQTVAQVRHVLDLFDLPPVPEHLAAAVARAAALGPVSRLGPGGEAASLPFASALGDPGPLLKSAAGAEYLVLTGALTDRLLEGLVQRRRYDLGLILESPTHLLVGRGLWRRWRALGGRAYVRRQVAVLAVTTNPYSPVGPGCDPRTFFEAVAAVAGRPVFDLEAGLSTI